MLLVISPVDIYYIKRYVFIRRQTILIVGLFCMSFVCYNFIRLHCCLFCVVSVVLLLYILRNYFCTHLLTTKPHVGNCFQISLIQCLKNWLKRKNRCPLCQLSGVARLHDPVTGAFAFPTSNLEQPQTELAGATGLLPHYTTNTTNQRFVGASDGSSSWNTSSLFSSSSSAGDFRL
jgi:hypothetical protein